MKSILCLVLTFVVLSLSLPVNVKSQGPPCFPDWEGSYFYKPYHQDEPPLSTDMPLDVLIGYIAFDSVSTHGNSRQVLDFIHRQTYNDTLKKIMRYWYKMVDWDCFRFESYIYARLYKEDKIATSMILREVSRQVKLNSPTRFLDITLLRSDVIAHIRVIDTTYYSNEDVGIAKDCYSVRAVILDTIKGRILPACNSYVRISPKKRGTSLGPLPQSCIAFNYCINWLKGGWEDVYIPDTSRFLLDEQGLPWIKTGKEYIVFLRARIVCDSTGIYFSFLPIGENFSYSFSMLPIEDGKVIDAVNEFGFGYSVPVDEFKFALRQKIFEIENY